MLVGCNAKSGLGNLGGQDGVFFFLPDLPIFPFFGQFLPNGNPPHPFFDPVIGIAFGFIKRPSPLGSQFRIFYLLHPLVTNLGQLAFKRLGLGGMGGLDNAEDAFGIGAIGFPQLPIRRGQLQPVTKCHDVTPLFIEPLF
jgi:hypothetical protein